MTQAAADLSSGKGHHDENFPVASFLIHPRHRAPILAFYRFARTADDVADSDTASADEKLDLLRSMHDSLTGDSDASPEAVALRHTLAEHQLSSQHGLDLLEAFRRDVTRLRYADWDDLMDYCRYSAMPVGRFVLDVHGEDHAAWPLSDALCAALQVINHLQDCGKDYRTLDRVYLPLDALKGAGIGPEALQAERASPPLRMVIAALAGRTAQLLDKSRPFADHIADFRLGVEVSVIQTFAENLNRGLLTKDPLSDRVHHGKVQMLFLGLGAASRFALSRAIRRNAPARPVLGS